MYAVLFTLLSSRRVTEPTYLGLQDNFTAICDRIV
jgi:hypothetical protein